MNWETFQTALQSAPENQRVIASGSAIPNCIEKAVTEGKVDQTQAKKVTQLFAVQYLDPNQKTAVMEELRKLGVPNGEELFKSLGFCVASAPADTDDMTSLEDDIKEAEEAMASVPKFRTMSEDMKIHTDEEPTYSSTQEAILKEGRTL